MKKLACRVGRHDWTTRVEEGESYKVCAACGKSPPDSRRPGQDSERKNVIGAGAEKPRDGMGVAGSDIGGGGGSGAP